VFGVGDQKFTGPGEDMRVPSGVECCLLFRDGLVGHVGVTLGGHDG